jgi:hypothetical protein
MQMKTIRVSSACLVVLLLAAPMLCGQTQVLSKYRAFSLGTSLPTVLKRTDQKPTEVKVIHARPALLQQLTWWPPNLPGGTFQADPVEQILFSFYNGELYAMSVTYGRTSTAGLTTEDMVKSISATYGLATIVAPQTNSDSEGSNRYEVRQKLVASWEDSRYSFNLVRSSFTDGFELNIYSKRANAEANIATAAAVKLDEQESPQREADRQKKAAIDLEETRQKNQKSFRP